MTSINAAQDSELTFLTGISDSGNVAATSFWTWNNDDPATYGNTSDEAKWGGRLSGNAGGVVTYGFDAASNWTAPEQAAFTASLSLWSAVANISFQLVSGGGSANIDIIRTTDSTAEGGITSLAPSNIGSVRMGRADAASISIDTSVPGFGPVGASLSDYGGYPWETILHEEGHALGLGHAGPYDGDADALTQQYTAYDTRAWSIMSYIEPTDSAEYSSVETPGGTDWGVSRGDNGHYYGNDPTTWMPLDILAIQRIYGVATNTPLSGGQIFGFNSNIVGPIEPYFDFTKNTTPVITFWDAGTGNVLDLSGYASSSTVNLVDGGFSSIDGLTNNIAIAFGTKIDEAIGGSANDAITANDDGDVLIGGGGGDNLYGGAGSDTFLYRSVDESNASSADIIHNFQTGVDKIDISALNAQSVSIVQENGYYDVMATTATGALLIHSISPVSLSDIVGLTPGATLTGTLGYDKLVGGDGNDVIIGGGSGDNLTGGLGADVFKYLAYSDSTQQSYDIITDFQHGTDSIDLSALTPGYISLVHYQGATYLFPSTAGGTMEIAAIGDVEGTDLNTGTTTNLYIVGDDNGDTLIGGAGADSIVGGAGNDVLVGGGGGDALYGGAGTNTFAYYAQSESNASGYDIIHDFKTGTDVLDITGLQPSNVSLIHYNGGTFVFGGDAAGVFEIGSTQTINGSDIKGLTGGVYIVGDDSGDTLIGSANQDTIVGGAGADTLIGGASADALYGGAGADIFKYLHQSDSTVAAPDIIHDFQTGVDKIDLTAVHTSTSDTYGLAYSGGATYLFVDQHGDGVNDMLIEIAGATLHASDILW